MSLNYQHLLILNNPTASPSAIAITQFIEQLFHHHHVDQTATLEIASITKLPARTVPIRNRKTGEMTQQKLSSRRAARARLLTGPAEISAAISNLPEFDLVVTATGIPNNPPLDIGYIHDDDWVPMADPYFLEICIRSRNQAVRLSSLGHDEIEDAPDVGFIRPAVEYQPEVDDDCTPDDSPGIYFHPDLGYLEIENAACGKFWIEFNYGKFLYPKATHRTANLLSPSLLDLARTTLGPDLIQACNWQ